MEAVMLPPSGRYFIIRSRLNDFVMTLDKDNVHVTMMRHVREGSSYQMWFEDHVTGTIRSKVNGYCLDISGRTIEVQSYKSGSYDQDLVLHGETVALRRDVNRVLDIVQENKEEGATLCVYEHNGQHNQHWTFEYCCPQYLVISSMSTSEQLTAAGAAQGAAVLVQPRAAQPQDDSQLWYEDKFGVIRSKLNHFALDSSKGDVCLRPYDPCSMHQQFVINGNTLINKHDNRLLLRIRTDQTRGTNIECGQAKNHEHERWMIKAAG